MSRTKAQVEEALAEARADLAAVDDYVRKLAFVDDGGKPVLQSHMDMHRHHGDRPYIGCIFCRDKFGELAPLEELAVELGEKSKALMTEEGSMAARGDAFEEMAEELEKTIEESRGLARKTHTGIGRKS